MRLSALRLPLFVWRLFFVPWKIARAQKRAARTGDVSFTSPHLRSAAISGYSAVLGPAERPPHPDLLPASGADESARRGKMFVSFRRRNAIMLRRAYPGRLTREQWLSLSDGQRYLLAARADADLLELWRSCSKKTCRRAHACHGDERCRGSPYQADFKNPNFRQPGYVFSYQPPQHLRIPSAILDHMAFWLEPPAPEQILEQCAAEAGAKAAAALRSRFSFGTNGATREPNESRDDERAAIARECPMQRRHLRDRDCFSSAPAIAAEAGHAKHGGAGRRLDASLSPKEFR